MLEVKNLAKQFLHRDGIFTAIKNFDFSVKKGEFVAVVGPSGCGKTTLLKLIAGLVMPTSGEIFLDGKPVAGPTKDCGVVFQKFSLFPWLTVEENISFGPKVQGYAKVQQKNVVAKYLEQTGLTEFADFYPKHLSGGQEQRVAIARTLANNPKIILMDEPFGALDALTRASMQEMLLNLWEREHQTIIFITHDVREALFLADTIYIVSPRPTTVKKMMMSPFPRPRDRALTHTKEFNKLEQLITKELETP